MNSKNAHAFRRGTSSQRVAGFLGGAVAGFVLVSAALFSIPNAPAPKIMGAHQKAALLLAQKAVPVDCTPIQALAFQQDKPSGLESWNMSFAEQNCARYLSDPKLLNTDRQPRLKDLTFVERWQNRLGSTSTALQVKVEKVPPVLQPKPSHEVIVWPGTPV